MATPNQEDAKEDRTERLPEEERIEDRLRSYDPQKGKIDLSSCGIDGGSIEGIVRRLNALEGLMTLDLSCNALEAGTICVLAERLVGIRSLDVSTTEIGSSGVEAIAKNMKSLRILNLSNNRSFGNFEAITISEHLPHLEALYIRATSICGAGPGMMAEGFTALRAVDVSDNDIGAQGLALMLRCLASLSSLTIGGTRSDLFDAKIVARRVMTLRGLTTLGMRGYALGDETVIDIATHLVDLTDLDLRHTKMTEVGVLAIAKHLTHLTSLRISGNHIRDAHAITTLLQTPDTSMSAGGLQMIDITDNPLQWPETGELISEDSIRQQDPEKLLRLLLDSRPGIGEEFLTARATMVGMGMSGKTRLSRWLVDHPKKSEDISPQERTIGIEPLFTTFRGNEFGHASIEEITITVLDCGGQQEQLQSHHNLVYRAVGRSLFVLCMHAGKDFRSREGNRGDYYLRMLQSYKGYGDRTLPVLIVVTHGELTKAEGRRLKLPNERDLEDMYAGLKIKIIDPYCGRDGKNIREVKSAMLGLIAQMPELRVTLPKGTIALRKAISKLFQLERSLPGDPLESHPKITSLTPKQFGKVCSKCKLRDRQLYGDYLRHLANLGVVIAPGVERTVSPDIKRLDSVVAHIFNPRFVNQHVYGLLMSKATREQMGFMPVEFFRNETSRLSESKRTALLGLLKRHLVVFEWKQGDQQGLLVPDLLPERVTPTAWEKLTCEATISFRMFLGEDRFFEFLASHKRFIKPLDLREDEAQMAIRPIGVFRNEVAIYRHPCEALVRMDIVEQQITIGVRGGTHAEGIRLREQLIGSFTSIGDVNVGDHRGWDPVSIERREADPLRHRSMRVAVGKGKHDLSVLQGEIEEWVNDHGFPWPQKVLADRFKCRESSLSVIVKRSLLLQDAKRMRDKHRRKSIGKRHLPLDEKALGGAKTANRPSPLEDVILQEEINKIRAFSQEQILSELAEFVPRGSTRQRIQREHATYSLEELRNALAWHRIRSSGQ